MGRCQQTLSYLSVPIGVLLLQACSGLGYQGGTIPTTFVGISTANGVSPQTIELDWAAYPGATKYNIYTPNVNNALYTPGFNQFLIQPVPADPTVTYQYSVTAVDPTTGLEQGQRSAYKTAYLLPHFNFKTAGSVTAVSDNSIRVNWGTSYPSVTYRVFYAERLPTGAVNYNGFVSSQNVVGQSSALISGLLEGHEYCAVVVAGYSDQTLDDPVGNLFTGEVSTHLNNSAYLVGASGSFGDSVIAQAQQCIRTQSNFSVSSLKIYTQKAQLSSQPVFYVSVPGEAAGAGGTVSTSIYQVNSSTGLSTLIGTRVGTGSITAQTPLASGRYQFFAIASDLTSPAQAQVEINVGTTGTTPTSDQNRPYVYIRSFNTSETAATTTGYYPEKQQGGYGSQSAGSSVAIGDFNCDGKKDVAIGIPNASVMAADNRPAQSGQVIIYYDTTSATPGTTTRSQSITFDITSFAGDSARNLQLGTSLYAGNFNGDNQLTNQYGVTPQESSFYQCDDLAIGSGYGPMFVLYGSRDIYTNGVISQYGGLNYTSPTSYTLNPSTSCDPASNVCQVGVYTQATNYSAPVGAQMTAGDYNGDGYTDLAVTSKTAAKGAPRGVWVFRGSEYGLIAPSAYNNNGGVDDITTSAGPHLSFPFIPSTKTASSSFVPPSSAPQSNIWGNASAYFGSSISTFHNAYYDMNGAGKGTGRIRDVLLIGNPSYPTTYLVHACIPKSDYTQSAWGTIGSSTDVNTAFQWDCSGAFVAPVAGASGFGLSMTDIKNPLRYRPDQFTDLNEVEGFGNNSASSTNLGYPGGFAVGAVTNPTSPSYVYVYYGVNTPVPFTTSGNSTTDRNTLGANRNAYLTAMLAGNSVGGGPLSGAALTVTTGSACVVASNAEACNIQKIQHPTTASGSFGLVLAALPGNIISDSAGDSKDTILAVAAPYRAITLSNGTTYTNAGSVQLFLQNTQNNQIVVRPSASTSASNYPCGSDAVCRYADGFSNTLTTSLDYDDTLNNNTEFGLGGIAGGPLGAPDSGYNSNSDIVIGVPGHVAHPTVSSGTPPTVIDNGAAFAFFSHGGTYRNYEVAVPDTSTTVSPWHVMDQSFSQESNMKFHHAISIGDINQDGVGDVAVRINQGSRNMIRIYNGSSTKVGFDNTAGDYTTFQIQGDTSAGIRFVPLGNITNTQSPAFLVSGATASYIMFGGIGGLIQGFPSVFGTGGTPRKLFSPTSVTYDSNFTSSNSSGIGYLDFSDTGYYNAETTNNLDSTLGEYANFATGDFNGDGYPDFAIGFNTNPSIADEVGGKNCTAGAEDYCGAVAPSGGSVMVFYGGADNGFQTQPDVNGGYPLDSNFFTEYSADSSVANATPTTGYVQTPFSNFGSACHADGTNCRIQMLHEGTTVTPTTTYGKSITSVPAGNCVSTTGVSYPVNALVVSAVKAGVPSLYTYRPKCLDTTTPNDYSGLISYADANPPAPATLTLPISTYASASSTFGQSMVSVTNVMGSSPPSPARSDLVSHLIVTDQANSWVVAYPVHTLDSNKASFIVPTAATAFASDTNFTNNGGRLVDYSNSAMMSGTSGTATGFGNGLASIGDVNGDGYNDLGVGISALNRQDTSAQTIGQGTVMVLFGGPGGFQSHTSSSFTGAIQPSRTASCYISPGVGTTVSTCNPALLYVPEPTNSLRNGAYERSFLSPFSFVATSSATNESLGTFLFGVPGRDSLDTLPSQRILQGGAFYVLP